MRQASRVLFIALAAVLLAASAASAADKWARGTITSVGGDSVTVDVKGQAMTFKVTADTDVVAPGAGTKSREAAKMTGGRPKITDVLKTGDRVEVRYTEADGVMTATMIRGGISAEAMTSDEAAKAAGKRLQGVVTAVSSTSFSVKGQDGTEMVFVADPKISVIGKGLGTMARDRQAKGEKLTLTDAVAVGDTVGVSYKEKDGKNHASEVDVIKKGT